MEIYFTILCIIDLCLICHEFQYGIADIALLIPAAYNFKMREITAKHLFNIG